MSSYGLWHLLATTLAYAPQVIVASISLRDEEEGDDEDSGGQYRVLDILAYEMSWDDVTTARYFFG